MKKHLLLAALLVAVVPGAVYSHQGVEASLRKAREAAASDRHQEAINNYRAAIEMHPYLAKELATELGHQFTWSGQLDSAVVWYQRRIDFRPDDFTAQMGLARALSWNDQLDEAELAYERAIVFAPRGEIYDARAGLAQVVSWKSDLPRAKRMYESILVDAPGHEPSQLGLAQVTRWMNDPREARGYYDDILHSRGENRDALVGKAATHRDVGMYADAHGLLRSENFSDANHMRRALEQDRAPTATYRFDRNDDNDDIERRWHRYEAALNVDWPSRITAGYARGSIDQPGSFPVTRDRFYAKVQHRFSEALAATIMPGVESNRFDNGILAVDSEASDGFDLFVIDSYVTVTPGDRVRMDVGFYRDALENPRPIYRNIAINQTSVGIDWRALYNITLAASAANANYSDDNRRTSLDTRLLWQPAAQFPLGFRNRWNLTTGIAHWNFAESNDNGYYSPDKYTAVYQRIAVTAYPTSRVIFDLGGRLGWEKETDDWFTVGSFNTSIWFRLVQGLGIGAGYYASESRLDSQSGYEANGFYLMTEYRFAEFNN